MLVSIEGEAKCELELELLPKDHRFAPWTFSVGPVPVVIVPKLNFQLTGEASVGARLSTYGRAVARHLLRRPVGR